jgi:eukaryotic-like serine/threonine-protein kinase
MPLQIHQQLGSYEITALLGKGGMGEVYRARDARLKRDVAIKVLPDEFLQDAERVSRFQREAEILASVNHSNVAGIYGLEEALGSRFLVLELVEGETLAERLARGPIPVNESLDIARYICEALEAAHEKGIIHRDLKPANIKVTPEGKVKVLDFGLAKAYEREPSDASRSHSPTISMAATNAGMILGTAAYMSPEQAKGRTVDQRTDVFAFGSVLYEMLTGKPAFDGDDIPDILGAVLRTEPDWSLLPKDVPPGIVRLLHLCLKKELKKRRQTATDVRIDIEQALSEPASVPTPTAVSSPRWAGARKVLLVVHALLTIALLAGAGWIYFRAAPPAVTRFQVAPPEGTKFAAAAYARGANSGTISPDGTRLVWFAADASGKVLLWVRSLDAIAAQPLNGTDNAQFPFWSPDSRFIGFFAEGKLKKIAFSGGPALTVTNAVTARMGTWSQSGVIVFSNVRGPLMRVPAEGGQATPIPTEDKGDHTSPFFLPDGRHFLFTVLDPAGAGKVYAGSLDSTDVRHLTDVSTNVAYAPPGYILFNRESTLFAQRFDAKRLEVSGEAVPIAEGVAFEPTVLGAFSVSNNGTLAFRSGIGTVTQLTWFDRTGKQLGVAGAPGNYTMPALSPDEKYVAVTRTDGQSDIWILELARNAFSRFTFDPAEDSDAVWSPDGKTIAFRSLRDGPAIYQKPAGGAGQEELVAKIPGLQAVNHWSPDGKYLLFFGTNTKTGTDIGTVATTGDRKIQWLIQSEFTDAETNFSPDGRWLAYSSNESGRREVYVQPFPANGSRWQVSTTGGRQPSWRRDGKELFYSTQDAQLPKLYAVDVQTNPEFHVGTPKPLFEMHTNTVTHFVARMGFSTATTPSAIFCSPALFG